jgi:energy-coupling factor transporter ATP-binding protein EcfA2
MPGSQNPNSLNLILENIGPIKNAEIELGRVTILYGANATGKTTMARAIADVVKLMNNIGIECSELAELVRHDAKVGRIVLNDYEVSLERDGFENVNVVIKRGAELHKGECRVGATYSTGLHIGDLVDTLAWVRYNNVKLIGVEGEDVLNLEMLLKPSVVKKYFGNELKAAKEYDDYFYNINHKVSALCGGWFVVQDDVFFNDGDYFYELDHIAEGIKRVALIIATKTLVEMLRGLGRSPIMFIENFEPALHVDYVEALLDELSEGNVPVIVETHSGFAIKYGARKSWSVYVLKDGSAFNDLTKPELFSIEAAVSTEVGGVL